MSLGSLQRGLATAVVAAACVAVGPGALAGSTVERFERLVARALNPSDHAQTTQPIDIVIERWSTNEECERLHDALIHAAPGGLNAILQRMWVRAGVIQLPGFQGLGARVRTRRSRIVQFARDIRTTSGRQVIVAIDQPLTLDQPLALRGTSRDVRKQEPEFTLIDIRFGPDGKGIGKVATADKVRYNQATGTIEIANYESEPVRLTEVKSEHFEGAPSRR